MSKSPRQQCPQPPVHLLRPCRPFLPFALFTQTARGQPALFVRQQCSSRRSGRGTRKTLGGWTSPPTIVWASGTLFLAKGQLPADGLVMAAEQEWAARQILRRPAYCRQRRPIRAVRACLSCPLQQTMALAQAAAPAPQFIGRRSSGPTLKAGCGSTAQHGVLGPCTQCEASRRETVYRAALQQGLLAVGDHSGDDAGWSG
jgi:hypothetical protein